MRYNYRYLLTVLSVLSVGLLATMLSACSSEPSPAVTATIAEAVGHKPESIDLNSEATMVELDAIDVLHAAEVWNLLAHMGDQAWPGWGRTPPPFLLRKGDFDYLIGHPAPPQGFEPLPNVFIQGQQVYRLRGHLIPRPAATAWAVGGVWSVALPTYEEFKQAITEVLGPGAVELDDVSFMRAVVHEAFHAYQFTQMGGMEGLPDFVQAVEEGQALERLAQQADLDAYHSALGQALRSGIEAQTDAQARQAAAQFLALRREWRANQPELIVIFEQSTEWLEGLARYADTHLMLLAGSSTYQAISLLVEQDLIQAYPGSDETLGSFLDQLADPAQIPGGLRDRYYVLGAGEGLLLDRLMPGWQAQAMPGGTTLEELLAQALTHNLNTSRPD